MTTSDIRIDAENLKVWLLMPRQQANIQDAATITAWLEILLTSCTPDSNELLVQEVERIIEIVKG